VTALFEDNLLLPLFELEVDREPNAGSDVRVQVSLYLRNDVCSQYVIMLERGAKKSTKFTNLREALQSHDPERVKRFLMMHDTIDLSRNSPNYARACLAWALRVSQDHIVRMLIKMETNVVNKYIGGKTFLHIALEANHAGDGPSIDSVKLLLNHMTHQADQTPLDSFVEVPSGGLAAGGAGIRARPSIDVNAIDDQGENALCGLLDGSHKHMEDAEDNYCNILSLLIKKGIDVNCRDSHDRQTLLHKAVKNGLYNIVQILLNKGADLNIIDKSGRTPVMLLFDRHSERDPTHQVQANLVKMLAILIAHGADITDNRGKNYFPLLMTAVVYDMVHVTRFMLNQYDVDIEETDENGHTALHLACIGGNTSIVTLLLDAGANKKALDNEGEEPLSENSMEEILDDCGAKTLEDIKAQFAIVHPTRAEIVGRLFLENRDSIKRGHDAMITLLNLRLDQNGMRTHTPHNRRSEEYEYSEEYPYHEGDQEEDDDYALPIMSRYPRFL
jgi:hypothetical protein